MIIWDDVAVAACPVSEDCSSITPIFDVPNGSLVAFPFHAIAYPSDGKSDIYYTYDGSDPDGTSYKYHNPILFADASVVVKARIRTTKGCWGPVSTIQYLGFADDSVVDCKFCCDGSSYDYAGNPVTDPFEPNGNDDLHWWLGLNLTSPRVLDYILVEGKYSDPITYQYDEWLKVRYGTITPLGKPGFWPLVIRYQDHQVNNDWGRPIGMIPNSFYSLDLYGDKNVDSSVMQDQTIPKYFQATVAFEDGTTVFVVRPLTDCLVCDSSSSSSSSSESSASSDSSDSCNSGAYNCPYSCDSQLILESCNNEFTHFVVDRNPLGPCEWSGEQKSIAEGGYGQDVPWRNGKVLYSYLEMCQLSGAPYTGYVLQMEARGEWLPFYMYRKASDPNIPTGWYVLSFVWHPLMGVTCVYPLHGYTGSPGCSAVFDGEIDPTFAARGWVYVDVAP